MKNILVLGAGLSTISLINYLLDHAESEDWFIDLGDMDLGLAKKKVNGNTRAKAHQFDICNLADHIDLLRKPFFLNRLQSHLLLKSWLV